MAFIIFNQLYLFLAVAISFACFQIAVSSDPDILFFSFTGMRSTVNDDQPPANFRVSKASMAEFPALNGQSVSFAILQYPAGSVNPPHTHPRAVELLFLIYVVPDVGVVDTTNKLYTQRPQPGHIFLFPKGLVHYQFNGDDIDVAIALSAFGSASARTESVTTSVLATGIDDAILAKSFKTDVATIQKLKAGLIPHNP